MNNLPNSKINETQEYILDPLSVIVKLTIISKKEIGTKMLLKNNIIYFQEPGPFQGFCRYINKATKTDLQYITNRVK